MSKSPKDAADLRWFELDAEDFDALDRLLSQPPPRHTPKLKALMEAPSPWAEP